MKCIGVDVGGTTVKIGLFETDGTLLEKWEIPTRKIESGKYILSDVADSIKGKLNKKRILLENVIGVGLGVPGPVMTDGQVEVCVNLGWKDKNPQKELSQLLNSITVRSGNDCNVAALGEAWLGGGTGYSDVVVIPLGTGVGGGIIINKKIITGKHALGGEVGHMHVNNDETEHCNCGNTGCLEQYASATGITRVAKRIMKNSELPSAMRQFGDSITSKDVFDAAKSGDELANEVAEEVGQYLGIALANICLTIDPEMFVIGGGVSKAGDFLINIIVKYYERYTQLSKYKGGVCLAKLGNDAGIYGAAKLILE